MVAILMDRMNDGDFAGNNEEENDAGDANST